MVGLSLIEGPAGIGRTSLLESAGGRAAAAVRGGGRARLRCPAVDVRRVTETWKDRDDRVNASRVPDDAHRNHATAGDRARRSPRESASDGASSRCTPWAFMSTSWC